MGVGWLAAPGGGDYLLDGHDEAVFGKDTRRSGSRQIIEKLFRCGGILRPRDKRDRIGDGQPVGHGDFVGDVHFFGVELIGQAGRRWAGRRRRGTRGRWARGKLAYLAYKFRSDWALRQKSASGLGGVGWGVRCGERREERGGVAGFEGEEGGFAGEAAGVAGEGAVLAEDAVAGDDPAEGVASGGGADGAVGAGGAEAAGDFAVGAGVAVGDGGDFVPDAELEGGAVEVDGEVEGAALAGGDLLKLEAGLGEEGVVLLFEPAGGDSGGVGAVGEGEAGEFFVAGGEEEGAERGLEVGVGGHGGGVVGEAD